MYTDVLFARTHAKRTWLIHLHHQPNGILIVAPSFYLMIGRRQVGNSTSFDILIPDHFLATSTNMRAGRAPTNAPHLPFSTFGLFQFREGHFPYLVSHACGAAVRACAEFRWWHAEQNDVGLNGPYKRLCLFFNSNIYMYKVYILNIFMHVYFVFTSKI